MTKIKLIVLVLMLGSVFFLSSEKTFADEDCALLGMGCGEQASGPRIECCSPNECTTNPGGGGPTCKKKLGGDEGDQ